MGINHTGAEFEPSYVRPVDIRPPNENEITSWIEELSDYVINFFSNYYNQLSQNEVAETIKWIRDIHDLPRLFMLLANREFVICPKMEVHATWLSSHLQEMFDDFNIGVVLMGAAIHGGVRMRRIFCPQNINSVEDFDWGLIYKHGSLSQQDLKSMQEIANDFFSNQLGSDLKSCSCVNPKNSEKANLEDTNQAIEIIINWHASRGESWKELEDILLFFEPSYPKRINDANKKLISDALIFLSKDDFNTWRQIVKEILTQWQKLHRIKAKHLESKTALEIGGFSLENYSLIIAQKSSRMMSKHMVNWLNATNHNPEKESVKWWV